VILAWAKAKSIGIKERISKKEIGKEIKEEFLKIQKNSPNRIKKNIHV